MQIKYSIVPLAVKSEARFVFVKTKPRDICPGVFLLDQTLIDYAAFFLRQPSRSNPTNPLAKSGSAAGRGTALTPLTLAVNVTLVVSPVSRSCGATAAGKS